MQCNQIVTELLLEKSYRFTYVYWYIKRLAGTDMKWSYIFPLFWKKISFWMIRLFRLTRKSSCPKIENRYIPTKTSRSIDFRHLSISEIAKSFKKHNINSIHMNLIFWLTLKWKRSQNIYDKHFSLGPSFHFCNKILETAFFNVQTIREIKIDRRKKYTTQKDTR